MGKMRIITVHLPEGMLKDLDKLVELRGHESRTAAIRYAILRLLRDEWKIPVSSNKYSVEYLCIEMMEKIIGLASGQVSKGKWYPCKHVYPNHVIRTGRKYRAIVISPLASICIHLLRDLGFRVEKRRSAPTGSRAWHFYLDLDSFYDDLNP